MGTTDYVDTGVVNGNTYCYYTVASNVSGQSDASNVDCATPFGLNPATDLVATGEVGNINLDWNAPSGNGGGGGGNDSCEDLGLIECPDGSCAPSFDDCDGGVGGVWDDQGGFSPTRES